MGRTGNISENENIKRNRPSIISILLITVIFVSVVVGSVTISYNLTKRNYSKSDAQKEKEDIIEKIVADIDKTQNSVSVPDNEETEITIKTVEEIKEENAEYTEEYKKYENELNEEEKEKSEVIPRKYEIEFEEIEVIIEEQEKEKIENKIPSSFDLRDKITIETKNQGSYGLCWDFALTKCVETNLELTMGKHYDLSEMYVDYILSSEYSDGNYYRKLHNGGSGDYIKYIDKMVLESDFPYGEYSVNEYKDAIGELEGKVYIQDYVMFPSSYGKTDEEIKTLRDTIKKHIMNYGSIYCSIPSPNSGADYVSGVNVFYTGEEKVTGYHAVSIIGWDDNYSKDNFDCSKKPSNDGAYIAVNSWGYGNQEYLYISYEDKSVESSMVGVKSVSTEYVDNNERIKIEDKELYNALKSNINYCINGYDDNTQELLIKKGRINDISSISFNNCNIKSLNGIEHFEGLMYLSIRNSELSDISQLSKLNNLTSVYFYNDKIEDFSALSNLEKLTSISIIGNPVKDINFLNKMETLKNISISDYNITEKDIKYICNQKELYQLALNNCNITDASFLQKIETLKSIDLSNNPNIKNIKIPFDAVSINFSNCGLTDVDFIDVDNDYYNIVLSNNDIKSVKQLENFEKISSVDLSGNKNLEFYDGFLSNVESLTLNDCNIESVKFLYGGNYRAISLEDNVIERIDENIQLDNLVYINLANNPIVDLSELKKLPNLGNINAENCGIKDASAFNEFNTLRFLTLNNNPGIYGLANIKADEVALVGCELDNNTDVFSNASIHTLYVNDNNITYIDPNVLKNSNMRMITMDDKVENVSELYLLYKDRIRIYCPELTIEKNIALPSCKKLVLKRNSSMLSNPLINLNNCQFKDNFIILDIDDKDYFDFGFTENNYNTNINYIYHCTIDDSIYANEAYAVSNKIINKIIYETGEMNFDVLSLKLNYTYNDEFDMFVYYSDFKMNLEDINQESDYLDVGITDYTAHLPISVFPKDMQTYKVEDAMDFTTILETMTYEKIYTVNYDERSLVTSPNVLDTNREYTISRKLNDKELYKILENVSQIKFEYTQASAVDLSIVDSFHNLRSVNLINCYPYSLTSTLNKGIRVSGMLYYSLRHNIDNLNEDIIKIESGRVYLPKMFYELYKIEGYNVFASCSIRDEFEEEFDENGEYIEPKVIINEYKVDADKERLYFENVSFENKKIEINVSIFVDGVISYYFTSIY